MEYAGIKTASPAPLARPIRPLQTGKKAKKTSGKLEPAARGLFLASAWLSACAIALIFGFLMLQGFPAFEKIGFFSFVSGQVWSPSAGKFGILPMIAGTLGSAALAALLAVPAGVLCAVFLHGFCPAKARKPLSLLVSVMAGVPSVVYGFFGLTVLVPWIRVFLGQSGSSLLAAALILTIMILPTIITVSLSSLQAVDPSVYQGSRGLGASHEQALFSAVLPAAKHGILSSVILGLGRAAGETMAVVMVAGNQPVLPHSLLDGIRTLSANIVLEMGYAIDLHLQALSASAVILLVIVVIVNTVFALMSARREKKA